MLVSTETGGLGNRIKSWVSARRLSSEARLFWPVTANMPATFSELFANDFCIDSVPAGADTYKSWRLAVLPEDEIHIPRGFAVVGAGRHPLIRALGASWWKLRGRPDDRYRYMVFPKQHSLRSTRRDARHIDLEYGRIPAAIRTAYAPYFAQLQPVEEIRTAVDQWWRTSGGDDLIGVQVRTWRDDVRRYRKYHLPARPRLLELMRAAPADRRFLLVSDSDEFIEFIGAAFGKQRIVSWQRTTPREQSWSHPAGIAEDLIDMLLLARCRRLFASYLSTFSETAWWLGGAQSDVSVF